MTLRPFVAVTLLALFALGLVPRLAVAGNFPVRGEGKDANGLAFEFRAKGTPVSASGEVSFETFSFGIPTGPVTCLHREGKRAALSGTVSNPVSGLTHFLIIVQDRGKTEKGKQPKDKTVTWLRNGPFNCETEINSSLADSLARIKKGDAIVEAP